MDYEIVTLPEKIAAGLCVRTGNDEPDVMQKIGEVWGRFFSGACNEIPDKAGDATFGLYTNYEGDVKGKYDMLACSEVSETQRLPDKFKSVVIPAGKYAKFVFHGDAQKDTGKFWTIVWNTALCRNYTCDFEEYPPSADSHDAPIHIYIALAEQPPA